MKKMELPEMMFVELTAGDVIATSDDHPYCNYVCDVDCWNENASSCKLVCSWYCEEENIGELICAADK